MNQLSFKFSILFFAIILNAGAITFEEFSKLTSEEKVEYFENEYTSIHIEKNEDLLKYPKEIKIFIDNLPETELYLEIEDDVHGMIGPVQRSYSLFYSSDNVLIGGVQYFFQQGCSHEDDNGDYIEMSEYYETEEIANQNNCFDNDVSYSGYSYRDFNGAELSHSDYMEWSGH